MVSGKIKMLKERLASHYKSVAKELLIAYVRSVRPLPRDAHEVRQLFEYFEWLVAELHGLAEEIPQEEPEESEEPGTERTDSQYVN